MMVRRLTSFRHIPALLALGRRWHAKTALAELPFSDERATHSLRKFLQSPDYAVLGAFDGDELCGVLIGALCHYPFFGASYATDIVFVADKHGAELFHAYRNWAAENEVDALQQGITSGLPEAAQFYCAEGLDAVGAIFFTRNVL